MPVFALFNAGVQLGGGADGAGVALTAVTAGAFLGLLLGKPVGITLFVALAAALRITRLPVGVNWAAVAGVGLLGGIGFTMALFIAMLAFGESPALDQAKVGVLASSVCAAVAGYALLRATLPAASASPAEAPVGGPAAATT
jgi:NhaA family Na+:H+ antiporter